MEHTTIAVDLAKSVFRLPCRIGQVISTKNEGCHAIGS
jgi:hypothetical protein